MSETLRFRSATRTTATTTNPSSMAWERLLYLSCKLRSEHSAEYVHQPSHHSIPYRYRGSDPLDSIVTVYRVFSSPSPKVTCGSRAAWACALTLVGLSLGISEILRIWSQNSPSFTHWLRTNSFVAQNALKILRATLWISVAYYFSGARSARDFLQRVGLSRRPSLPGWWCGWVAIAIAILDRYGGTKGLTSPNPVARGFYRQGGEVMLFFVLFVVSVGPFYEELALRGFLYQAFRGSYGLLLSAFLVVCVSAYFHWGPMTHSFWTPACLVSLWILLCMVR